MARLCSSDLHTSLLNISSDNSRLRKELETVFGVYIWPEDLEEVMASTPKAADVLATNFPIEHGPVAWARNHNKGQGLHDLWPRVPEEHISIRSLPIFPIPSPSRSIKI